MTTYYVKNTVEFNNALNIVGSGDVIALASGTYGALAINGLKFSSDVTITSIDSEHPAILTGLSIKGSSGLTISNVDMSSAIVSEYDFSVYNSSDVHFDGVTVYGPANIGSGNEANAFMIRNSSGVSVTNSEFYNLKHGINMLDNTAVTIADNYFHDIRSDGVRGGGNSDLKVSDNFFTNFYPADGDHPDAIQLWTTNTTASASNIEITNNVFVRGDGDIIQGVFLRDQVGNLPFENVTITGNSIIGGMYNGIFVNHVTNGVITDNLVVGLDGQQSWIRTLNDLNVVVGDNVATGYLFESGGETRLDDNTKVDLSSYDLSKVLASWAETHSVESAAFSKLLSIYEIVTTDTAVSDPGDTVDNRSDDVASPTVLPSTPVEVIQDPQSVTVDPIKTIEVQSGERLYMYHGEDVGVGLSSDDHITANDKNNILYGHDGNDRLDGGAGNDVLWGGEGNDNLWGQGDNDVLHGENGNDRLYGGDGDDVLLGGAGDDFLQGGNGSDTMTGGAGNDHFYFRDADMTRGDVDTITDFVRGTEKIGLSMIDANRSTVQDDSFKFIGTDKFHGIAGELRYDVINGNAHVTGDWDGDGQGDFTIILQNIVALNSHDFCL